MKELVIKITVSNADAIAQIEKLEAKLKEMQSSFGASTAATNEKIKQSAQEASEKVNKIGSSIKQTGHTAQSTAPQISHPFVMIAQAALQVVDRVKKIIGVFKELQEKAFELLRPFELGMFNISTLLDEKTMPALEGFRQTIINTSITGNQSLGKLTESMYNIISAGFGQSIETIAQAQDMLKQASIGATVGVTDEATAAKALIAVMGAWRGSAGSAADVMDVLTQTVRRGVTTFPQLAHNVGKVAAVAAQAGISFKETMAAFTALTKSGLSADSSMTYLKNVIAGVIKPAEQSRQLFEKLGIEIGTTALRSKGLVGVMDQIAAVTGGSADVLAKLFRNMRSWHGATVLAGTGLRDFKEDIQEMDKAQGKAAENYARGKDTYDFISKQIKNILDWLLMEAFEPTFLWVKKFFQEQVAFFEQNKNEIKLWAQVVGKILYDAATPWRLLAEAVGFWGQKITSLMPNPETFGKTTERIILEAKRAADVAKTKFLLGQSEISQELAEVKPGMRIGLDDAQIALGKIIPLMREYKELQFEVARLQSRGEGTEALQKMYYFHARAKENIAGFAKFSYKEYKQIGQVLEEQYAKMTELVKKEETGEALARAQKAEAERKRREKEYKARARELAQRAKEEATAYQSAVTAVLAMERQEGDAFEKLNTRYEQAIAKHGNYSELKLKIDQWYEFEKDKLRADDERKAHLSTQRMIKKRVDEMKRTAALERKEAEERIKLDEMKFKVKGIERPETMTQTAVIRQEAEKAKEKLRAEIVQMTASNKGILQRLESGELSMEYATKQIKHQEKIIELKREELALTDKMTSAQVKQLSFSAQFSKTFIDRALQHTQSFASTMASMVDDLATGVGNTISGIFETLVSGQGNAMANAGKMFLDVLAGMAAKLGSFFILAGIGQLFIPPYTGAGSIAAGTALLALSGILKGASSLAGGAGTSGAATASAGGAGGYGGGYSSLPVSSKETSKENAPMQFFFSISQEPWNRQSDQERYKSMQDWAGKMSRQTGLPDPFNARSSRGRG